MKYTTNLNLKKPDYTDTADIQDVNDNMDIIDNAIGSHIDKGGSVHPVATTSVNGFMSAADKQKLNGIESGAQVNPTASEILTSLKTVDGSGSGLDADTLDGKHASQFIEREVDGGAILITGQDLNNLIDTGFYNGDQLINDPENDGKWWYVIVVRHSNENGYTLQIATSLNGSGKTYYRLQMGGTWQDWKEYWHSDNDGSGSGLDADKLDGLHASSFVRKDSNSTINDNIRTYWGNGGDLCILHDTSNVRNVIHSYNNYRLDITANGTEYMARFTPNGAVQLYYNNGVKLETTSTGAKVTGDLEITGNLIGAGTKIATGFYTNTTSTLSSSTPLIVDIPVGFSPKLVKVALAGIRDTYSSGASQPYQMVLLNEGGVLYSEETSSTYMTCLLKYGSYYRAAGRITVSIYGNNIRLSISTNASYNGDTLWLENLYWEAIS